LFSIHHNRTEVTLGGDSFWLDIFLDISERKYMEGELQKIREELEQRVEERTAKLQETNDALMNEIAERGKAESELFKFYWAVQQNPVMIILTDNQGTVEYVNPQFCEMTGYKFSEVIGQPIFQLTGVNRDSEQFKKFLSALMRKISWRGQHKTFKKDGEAFWVETIVSPVVNYEGEIKNYVAVQEDITPRKKTEEQMVIAKEKAEEADKLKSSIFANMSHEFRTPLISILGFSRLLSEEVEDSDFRMMSDNIFSAGNRLLRTLNNVLFLAQLDTIQANYTFVKLDINEYIKKVVDSFRQNAEEKQLAVIDELSSEPLFIDSPVEFPEMLVSQLIDNAVKFTKQGHIGVRSHAGHAKNGSKIVIIEVFDTGIGISPDFQNTIFQPFQQASIGYSRTFEGSGLGLSVTMRVLDLLGGTLDVQSKVGEGTRFIISIPAFPEEH
jgi:PAS domain S-box-containing protein